MAKGNKDKISIPAVGIVENIVFSKKSAWAYYKIASVPYDFLSSDGKKQLANDVIIAMSALAQKANKNVDIHILSTTTPFSVESWEEQMFKIYDEWNAERLDSFEDYMAYQSASLNARNYKNKALYLGVKLYDRGSFSLDEIDFLEFGFKEALDSIKKGISKVFILPDENINGTERNRAKREEADIYRAVRSGALRGKRVSSEELLLLNKRLLYPAMPSPYLEVNHDERVGLNDIVLETGAIIEDHRRYLKFNQIVGTEEMEGYRATLSFSKFPSERMGEPGIPPFMYEPTRNGLPFTMSARLTLVPVDKMKKDLQHKKLEAEDEIENLASSGQRMTSSIVDTQMSINELDMELNSDNLPWVSGSYRMTIEAQEYEHIAEAVQIMKQEYGKNDVVLTWTAGDQLDLLMEEMPGGELAFNDFTQLTNLAMIGTSGFNYGGTVGDPIDEKVVFRRRDV